MASPIVSIIMPTYNRAGLIRETLYAVRKQTFKRWECIIIDDGSTDETKKIIKPITKKDNRFSLIERDSKYRKGPSGCRNLGIDICKGDYIIFFDSDDIVHPQLLEICVNWMELKDIQFCNFEKTPFLGEFKNVFPNYTGNDKPQLINIENIEEIVTQKLGFACCTIMWDKKVLKGKYFNESLSYAEEWEFYIRLMSEKLSGIHIDTILYYHRKHPNSNTAEFWENNPIRKASKVHAVKLVIDNLKEHNLFKESLVKHFFRLGFQIKEPEIINYTLRQTSPGIFKKLKYKVGYTFYPILKRFFKLKAKVKNG
jgi:glycosyltransferase involved in cell wall biosynthesis|tara:strand:+ start:929 stop:1864 length:936 start_codon:yes stop_codon:yes gene_type:complete